MELSGVAATEETMCQEPTAATSGSNDRLGYRPTGELRWKEIRAVELFGRPQVRCIPGTDIAHILQQKWVSDCVGGADQWRDVPVVA